MALARTYLILALIGVGFARADGTVADWFPSHIGDKWSYEYDTRDENGQGRAHLVTHSWRTEEITTGSWSIPEGTVLLREVRVTKGSPLEHWHADSNLAYLIRGNCLYADIGWNPVAHQLNPDFQKDLNALSPDFCFPLVLHKTWGAPHGLPGWWVTLPEQAKDWKVVGIETRKGATTVHISSISSYPGSGETKDVWFEQGVGVVGEEEIHHGTIAERRTRLLGFVPADGKTALGQAITAHDPAEKPNWRAVCAEAIAKPLPPTAAAMALAPHIESAPADLSCDESALYYGFGKPPDYPEALTCAYRHRAHLEKGTGGLLDGAGTLAMLYANGDGVPRNLPLAIRFACELADRSGQNTQERIERLQSLRDGKTPVGTRFSLCDGQMSGLMGAYCAKLQGKLDNVGRARRIAAIEERLPMEARAMLPKLQAAEKMFEQARRRHEYDGGGGSGSAGFAMEDQSRLREQFVINLERFQEGKLPNATAADRDRAEQDLAAAYGAVTGTLGNLEETATAWRNLLDAWLRFLPVAYPELSRDAAATELLRLRVHQVRRALTSQRSTSE